VSGPYRDVRVVLPRRAIPSWVWLIVAAYVAKTPQSTAGAKASRHEERKRQKALIRSGHGNVALLRAIVSTA
jgi:hypothetical protein